MLYNLLNALNRCAPSWCAPRSCAKLQLLLEQLEDRSLPNAATILAALHDPSIRTLAQADFQRDSGVTRNDMIAIFNTAAQEGKTITATELGDLKTLVNHSSALGMPLDVANLAGKVIGYNPANTEFQGKTLISTGQLASGQNSIVLTDLVDKWFLGQDLPLAVDYWGTVHPYATASGTLFSANGPSDLDIVQGGAADCYFLASLGETTARDPQAIRNVFTDNGDGTFTVRFFHQVGSSQVADYVTVNRSLPINQQGRFEFANWKGVVSSATNVLWVALAEKAYAQLAAESWSRAGQGSSLNSYGSIGGGFGNVAMQQILGVATSKMFTTAAGAINTLILDLTGGDLITIDSDSLAGSNVIADHEYYVTGYDAVAKTFTVVNPWGANLATIGTLHLNASQVMSYFGEINVAA